jgi:hypothetical protein
MVDNVSSMTTQPPPGAGWPPPQPQGGTTPEPRPFPAAYPPPASGAAGSSLPAPPADPAGLLPLPDPPRAGKADALPEPPAGLQPALAWGDPTPAPTPPPRPGPPPPYSKLAVTTLGLGLLGGAGGLALVTGVVALLRLRTSRKRGRGLAIGGMVLTVAWAALAALVYVNVLSQPPLRDAAGTVTRKGDIAVTKLRTGDCIENWTPTTEVGKVTVVPCATAHNAEVFHTFDVAGKDFPGDGPIREQSSTQCLDSLKKTITEADRKNIKVAVFKPIAASWQRGEHNVACVAVQNDGTVTRSIRVP